MPQFEGFRPKVARQLLGISQETLRYWRAELDPVPTRPLFRGVDLVSYRVIKELIVYLGINVAQLARYEVGKVFDICEKTRLKNINNFIIQVDRENESIEITTIDSSLNRRNHRIHYIYMEVIMEKHYNHFDALGY